MNDTSSIQEAQKEFYRKQLEQNEQQEYTEKAQLLLIDDSEVEDLRDYGQQEQYDEYINNEMNKDNFNGGLLGEKTKDLSQNNIKGKKCNFISKFQLLDADSSLVKFGKKKRKSSGKLDDKQCQEYGYDSDKDGLQYENGEYLRSEFDYEDEEEELSEEENASQTDFEKQGRKDKLKQSSYEEHSINSNMQKRKELYDKTTKLAAKREEEHKKKMDPTREYVMKEGLDFLQNVKCINNKINVNKFQQDQQEDKKIEIIQKPNVNQQQKEHWILHDRANMPLRNKKETWEQFMTQSGIHSAKRIYLSMPGSVYPSIVLSYTKFRPRLGKRKYKKSHQNTNSSSSNDSISSDTSSDVSKDQIDISSESSQSNKSDHREVERNEEDKVKQTKSSNGSDIGISDSIVSSTSSDEESFQERFKKKEYFDFKPLYLDDSKIRQGKHMHVISLSSYKMSILPFVNPQRKKEEMNRVFQKQNPKISKSLSLSKIRKIKQDIINIFLLTNNPYIEVYTICRAWVIFEKLIYKGMVKKHNRKIIAAICLLIAVKNTEMYGGYKLNQNKFKDLNQDLQKLMRYQPKNSLIYYEIKILSRLNFHITVPLRIVMPHMHSILNMLDQSMQEYLGSEAYKSYLIQKALHRRIQFGRKSQNRQRKRKQTKLQDEQNNVDNQHIQLQQE